MGYVIYDTANILTNPDSCIVLYNVFSPNGDGIHDFWEINNIELYPEALIEVYDRNGRKVFLEEIIKILMRLLLAVTTRMAIDYHLSLLLCNRF